MSMAAHLVRTKFAKPCLPRVVLITFLLFSFNPVCIAEEGMQAKQTVQVGEDLSPRFSKDETYGDECGSCHIAYPPMLLPKKSWQNMMSGLEDHFGENAELDVETASHISAYLIQNSLESESGSGVSDWQKAIPVTPPIRITELAAFVVDHEEPYKLLGESAEEPGFFAPCRDCHKEAEDGIFDKDRLFRGARGVFRRFSDIE